MLKRYRSAAIAVSALLITSSALFAAGNWSTLPIVGGAAYCNSTVTGAGGLSGVTGQGQATTGSICGSTTPAGPSIVTGTEVIPADLYRPDVAQASLGAQPQTAYLSLGSLNALPILVSTIPTNVTATLSASSLSGGVAFHSTATVTAATITLPTTPIDGQQYAITSDQTITTLVVTATGTTTIQKAPTVITPSTTGSYGYRFLFNAALATWIRLQ